MHDTENHDLDWQAFRYVANELAEPELAAFESLLAHDQLAREAVVKAVELTHTILAAESLLPVAAAQRAAFQRYGDWSTSLTWFTLGAAACLALMWTLQNGPFLNRAAVSSELAEVWSTQLANTADDSVSNSELSEETTDTELVLLHEPASGWMMEAIRSLEAAHETEGDSSEEMES